MTTDIVKKAKDLSQGPATWPVGGAVVGFILGGPVGALVGGVGAYLFKTKVL